MDEPLPFGAGPPPQVRQLKMIVGFLILGVVSFAAIAFVLPPTGGGAASPATMRIALLALGGTAIPMAFVLRLTQLRVRPDDEQQRIARFFVATIMSNALMEGVALFACVIFMLGRDPLDLVGVGIPVLLMLLAFFPTDGRWRAYAGEA